MGDLGDFHIILGSDPNLTYNTKTIEDIHRHRRSLDNELFFDRLLKAVGIDQASNLYPPRSNQDLHLLFDEIASSTSPSHHKQSIIYYILKDLAHRGRSAERYAEECFLPGKYQIFLDGIWYFDRLQFELALDHLTEPCLIPTFPQEILYTLCTHSKHDTTLPLSYYYTVQPALSSSKVLDAFFTILCKASITEAFYFSRGHDEPIHRRLFEKLIDFVHSDSDQELRASRGVELIGLPLDEEEAVWLEGYLIEGKGAALPSAQDTLVMKRMATGQLQDAAILVKSLQEKKSIQGLSWTSLGEKL